MLTRLSISRSYLTPVVRVYSELAHLGTRVGTKRVGLPDPRLGVEQAWLCHHHGAHLRGLKEEKHHWVSGRYQRPAEPSPCRLTIAYAIMPVGVVAGKATTDGAWRREGGKKSFLLENQDSLTGFQKPRWSGTKLSGRFSCLFLPSLLLSRVERNIHVRGVNEAAVFPPLLLPKTLHLKVQTPQMRVKTKHFRPRFNASVTGKGSGGGKRKGAAGGAGATLPRGRRSLRELLCASFLLPQRQQTRICLEEGSVSSAIQPRRRCQSGSLRHKRSLS